MLIQTITIKFDILTESFDNSKLIDFIKDKDIINISEYFFEKNNSPYLLFVIYYNLFQKEIVHIQTKPEKKPENEKWRKILNEKDMPLFNILRNWRAERAKKEGLPSYIICKNNQLAQMIKEKPTSISALLLIDGIGKAKAEKYGNEILELLTSKITEPDNNKQFAINTTDSDNETK